MKTKLTTENINIVEHNMANAVRRAIEELGGKRRWSSNQRVIDLNGGEK